MIFDDFRKALGQMGDPRFRRVLFLGVGLTVLLLAAIYVLFMGTIQILTPNTLVLPFVGEVSWVDDLLSSASILLMTVLSVFLMVPVASAFTGLFLDDVADAVEDKHYPHLTPAPRVGWGEMIRDSLAFLGVIVLANLAALVFYLISNIGAPLIFWAMNGFLLGREYFQMVALRRLGREGAKAARRRHMGQIWLAGALMAVPLSVPIVNLLIPVLGAATFTHMFHRVEPGA